MGIFGKRQGQPQLSGFGLDILQRLIVKKFVCHCSIPSFAVLHGTNQDPALSLAYFLRYAVGVRPVAFLNCREK